MGFAPSYRVDRHVRDYLGANEVWHRSVFISLKTSALLRKPDNRRQRNRQRELADDVRRQAAEQMKRARRRAFRGDVSVALTIFAPYLPSPPAADTTVKAYLDALTGVLWADDRQISHIGVDRLAADNPRWRDRSSAEELPSLIERGDDLWVTVTAMPARVYREHYDRTFDLREEVAGASGVHRWLRRMDDPGAYRADEWNAGRDDDDLNDLYRERRDAAEGRGIYSFPDYHESEPARLFRERRIAELEMKLLFHERPGPGDRPGPAPEWPDREFFERFGLPWIEPPRQYDGPGAFRLRLPPEEKGAARRQWEDQVRAAMEGHRARWRRLPAIFAGPTALDIAARGMGENSKDIDNLAHIVLRAFEAVLCAERRGTVTNYRAYRAEGGEPGVRVIIMASERLEQLEHAMNATRDYLMRRGPHSDRYG